MGVREQTSSIKALQANALQDYLEIVLHENNLDLSEWRQQYASFVNDQHKGKISSVAEVYKKIALYGADSIDIQQLDTSAIINYLRYGKLGYKTKEEKKETGWYLCRLQEDRNIDAHVNGNESSCEIYQFAVTALAHLMSFVDFVWNDRKGEATGVRYEYTKKYRIKITQTLSELDKCYRKEIVESNRSIKGKIGKRKWLYIGILLITVGLSLILYYNQSMLEKILSLQGK